MPLLWFAQKKKKKDLEEKVVEESGIDRRK